MPTEPRSAVPLRAVLVGCGQMGRHHAAAIRRLRAMAELVAVVDSDPERADALARDVGPAHTYVTLESCLAAETPDVVHVCTPPFHHASAARQALAAGANVYVEKPVASSLEEARELIALAAGHERLLWPGHQLLFEAPTVKASALISRLGEIDHVESYFAFRQSRPADGTPPLPPGDQLLDILPHPAYLLAWFLRAGGAESFNIATSEVDDRGRLYAIVKTEGPRGILCVTLEGRPVDSFVRVVGSLGTINVDYVRGTVLSSMGQGRTIEKILDPYFRAASLVSTTTANLAKRLAKRERSYPGLKESFTAFYGSIRRDTGTPIDARDVLWTAEVCDHVRRHLHDASLSAGNSMPDHQPRIAVTGGAGFLGRAVLRALVERGHTPLAVVRNMPSAGRREAGARYQCSDLAAPSEVVLPEGIKLVIHCAAETVGGWVAHQRNSVDATQRLLASMSRASIRRLVHVSSIAVLDTRAREPVDESAPLEREGRSRGAYVWGKLESEKLVREAAARGEIEARIVRPAALMDREALDPPGKLGRAIGRLLVAVGPANGLIGTCDVRFAAHVLAHIAEHFDDTPEVLHLLEIPSLTRRDLVSRLRGAGWRAVWLPWPVAWFASTVLLLLQRLVRPGKPALNLAAVFRSPKYSTARIESFVSSVRARGAPPELSASRLPLQGAR